MSAKKLFVFGYGATAAVLGQRLLAKDWKVTGTCRTQEKIQSLQASGIEALCFNEDVVPQSEQLSGTTHLLISVPPGADGDLVLAAQEKAIEAAGASIEWIGYLSTTGVYGDRAGQRVEESDDVHPTSERGRRRVKAENAWFAFGRRTGIPVQTFRLAGIYGPGRNQIASLRSGKARRIVKLGHVFSRVHVEDIASVLEASIAKPRAGAAYNVCDDEAAPPQDVVAFAASLAGLEVPPEITFSDAGLSPMARSFYDESKRVANDLIKRELGACLQYPTYKEGLTALYKAGE